MFFSRENGHSDPKKCKISKFSDSLGGGRGKVHRRALPPDEYHLAKRPDGAVHQGALPGIHGCV